MSEKYTLFSFAWVFITLIIQQLKESFGKVSQIMSFLCSKPLVGSHLRLNMKIKVLLIAFQVLWEWECNLYVPITCRMATPITLFPSPTSDTVTSLLLFKHTSTLLPPGLCSCCFLCLNCLLQWYLHGQLPYLLYIFAEKWPSQWELQ